MYANSPSSWAPLSRNNQLDPTGAAPPPPKERPNFASPQDAGHWCHIVYISLIQGIVVVFFAVRTYVKLSVSRKFGLEDWSCLIGWIFTVILNSTVFMKLHFGEGFHIWEITQTNFTELQKWIYISSLLYSPAAFFIKASLLLLTVRFFSVDKIAARTLHLLLAFFAMCFTPAEVVKAVVCIPVQSFWDTSIPNPKCIDQTKLSIYDSTVSIFSDLVILIVPVILTWKLRESVIKKIKVVGLLGTGGLGLAVTVYRLFLVIKFNHTQDPTVDFVPLDWTATGELAIGVVCACFPSINHLLEQRAANRVQSSNLREPLRRCRETTNKIVNSLAAWGMGRASRTSTATKTKTRTTGLTPVLAATTPESGFDQPQHSDNDIELAARSTPRHGKRGHHEPHPGEPVFTTPGNDGQS